MSDFTWSLCTIQKATTFPVSASWVYGDEPCKMDTFASMKHIVMVALNVVFLLSTRITFLNEKRNSRCWNLFWRKAQYVFLFVDQIELPQLYHMKSSICVKRIRLSYFIAEVLDAYKNMPWSRASRASCPQCTKSVRHRQLWPEKNIGFWFNQ